MACVYYMFIHVPSFTPITHSYMAHRFCKEIMNRISYTVQTSHYNYVQIYSFEERKVKHEIVMMIL